MFALTQSWHIRDSSVEVNRESQTKVRNSFFVKNLFPGKKQLGSVNNLTKRMNTFNLKTIIWKVMNFSFFVRMKDNSFYLASSLFLFSCLVRIPFLHNYILSSLKHNHMLKEWKLISCFNSVFPLFLLWKLLNVFIH